MTGASIILFSCLSFGEERVRSFRHDLEKKITALCATSNALSGHEFLKQGIYDSQSLAFIFKKKSLTGSVLENIWQQESTRGYYGQAIASCGDEKSLLLVTRSPTPMNIQNNELSVPSSVKELCSSMLVNFINAKHGRSQSFSFSEKIKVPNENGVLSVSCLPKNTPQWGKQTWFLIPTGSGPEDLVPEVKFLESNEDPEKNMQMWLNAVRKREGIPSVDFENHVLKEITHSLGANHSIEHNRDLNKWAQNLALRKGLRLVGENRAQASSLQELAWLLWNSPRHRDLLLNQSVQFASTEWGIVNKTWFLLWVFAVKKEKSGV